MTRTELLAVLEHLEPAIAALESRVVPSSFDPDDPEMRAVPLPLKWRWVSCEALFAAWQPRIVMSRLPIFLQVEPLLYAACQTVGAPIALNEPQNMPVGRSIIEQADVDTLVTTVEDASVFSAHLAGAGAQLPRRWLLIESVRKPKELPAVLKRRQIAVAREMHLFPGVPVLAQCLALSAQKKSLYHAPAGCDVRPGAPALVSVEGLPFEVRELELPISLHHEAPCACGREMFAAS